ncbi:MAG: winged helix-turn-helix transcriptional regulator [Hyphomicrobiales bacterium]|nr:winged helix-turn-helix transcriptional regulator [Hyphomicrobiales bacterium]
MASSSRLADMYHRPGFLLKRCHQVAMAIFLEEGRAFNITQSQYGCLRALQAYPGVDQIALGRLVGLDRSTSAMVIRTLSERGLIGRVVDERDRRRMRLELTAQGGRVLDDMAAAAARAQERALAGLPRASRAAFLDMLERFLAGHRARIDVDQVLAGLPEPEPARPRRRAALRAVARRSTRVRGP